MDSTFVIAERRDSLEFVCLNRPEKLNALSREMILALSDVFKNLKSQSDLRAIILTGAGSKAFSAGTDITELTGLDRDRAREVSDRGQALCNQIESCGVPVIAGVNGIAAGGGCELVLACHSELLLQTRSLVCLKQSLALFPVMVARSGWRAKLVRGARSK